MSQLSHSFSRFKGWFDTTDRLGTQVAQIASNLVILVGWWVLIGWKLDLMVLKSVIPGFATMKANTAICFILAGISLGLQTRPRRSSRLARIAKGCAIVLIIIASVTICQYLFGWDLGIDELLFPDPDSPATTDPGRMGINTAVNFWLTGGALWLINRQERKNLPSQPQHQVEIDKITIAQIMTTVAGAFALQAIVGYAYNVRVLYQLSVATTSMTLHTALSFGILCVGILALKGDRGYLRALTSNLIGGDMAKRLIPIAIVVPLLVGWLISQGLPANLYDPNFGLSLLSMSMVVIWLGIIRQNAGILNQMDYDRIRSADRIRSSEERLKRALDGAKQGTWDIDAQTQILTWDDRCNAIFGLSPDAVVMYAEALTRVHPDDRDRTNEAVNTAIRERGEFAQEYRTVHPDGTVRWVLSQGKVYCDSTGEPDRMLGTMMDITERKHAQLNERFLYKLTQRLRKLANPEAMQWEAAKSVGEYFNVDRATWFEVDWARRLARISRDWNRDGVGSIVGEYPLGKFLSPAFQAAMFAGESVAISDVAADPLTSAYIDNYQQVGIRAFTNIPCIDDEGRWVGTLHLNTTQNVRSWRDDEIGLMQVIATQLWSLMEQARAVQALRAQEQQTRAAQDLVAQQLGEIEAIYQTAPVGLCFVDTDLRFVRLNERLATINHLPVWAHIGRTLREVLPTSADTLEPLYRQVIESGEPILDLEVSGIDPAQPEVLGYCQVSYYPQKDATGRVVGVNAMVQDITNRKHAEADLREGEERFRTLADNISQLAWMTDASGWIFWYNQRWFDYTGTTLEEMQGWGWQQVHHPEYVDRVVELFRHHLEIGEPWEDTFPLRGRDGTYRWFLSRAIPIVDEAGQVLRWFGTNTDITEQQTALRELNQAQADLERRNQELDSFVYVVAHDLKAPLRGIANLSQWIEDDLEGAIATEIQQHTILLRNRIQRMEATIDGLLDYARIGRTDETIESVALAKLLADVIDSIAPPPTFTIDIPPDLPILSTKRLLLFQVLSNLIANSIKHHDSTDGSIQISCQECGDFYEFTIADDGPGIDPVNHERIFGIFQAVNPQKRADSTGIGLAIVRKTVEAEGGTIRLESQLGKGTTFYFTWPK